MTQYDNGVPDFLRRDANNRAPFMDVTVDAAARAFIDECGAPHAKFGEVRVNPPKMPWEP